MFWIFLTLTVIGIVFTILAWNVWYFDLSETAISVITAITIFFAIATLVCGLCALFDLYDYDVLNSKIALITNNNYTLNVNGDTNVNISFNDAELMKLQLDLIEKEKSLKLLLFR